MILDTNFLGALYADDPGAIELAEEIESKGLPARIPTAVIFEVFYGIEGADNPDQLQSEYELLFASKPRTALTERVARRAGRFLSRSESSNTDRNLDLVDAMVAGTGLDYDEPVVTNDQAYQDVEGLAVRTY
jgi:predicted nucleic acid-binding protein